MVAILVPMVALMDHHLATTLRRHHRRKCQPKRLAHQQGSKSQGENGTHPRCVCVPFLRELRNAFFNRLLTKKSAG